MQTHTATHARTHAHTQNHTRTHAQIDAHTHRHKITHTHGEENEKAGERWQQGRWGEGMGGIKGREKSPLVSTGIS